jgi:SAM-dependent methyltransferase
MKQWYQQLFENFAGNYERESFVQGTMGEVDFIEQEINFDKSKTILDVGCGTGRHSVELAARGYSMTAFDLSPTMIRKARNNAAVRGVQIDFSIRDARSFRYRRQFDCAIMMCEGSFPLMENDEMNFSILKSIHRALKPGGKIIFTTLNGLFPLFHSVKDFINSADSAGKNHNNSFDLMTFRDHSDYEITDDDGKVMTLKCNERYYVPSEIHWLLSSLGFTKIAIHGARLGAFSRQDTLTTEDYEMLVIAEKAN